LFSGVVVGQRYITKQYKTKNFVRFSNILILIVDDIQYRLKLTHEDIAARLGYTRPYFTTALKKGGSDKLLKASI